LRRWNIDEASLPAGSIVQFREPTVWQQYRWYIIPAAAFGALQAIFIAVLLVNGRRLHRAHAERRRAEESAHALSGQLISAQEEERSRLARELHDDVTQRLALLAIDAGREERRLSGSGGSTTMRTMREGLVRLSEDVHALSYRLHPSILEDLGLIEALKSECERFSRTCSIRLEANAQDIPEKLPHDVALCLFRIAQEGLRNMARHAGASRAEVRLRRLNGGLQLAVMDDGAGFDPARHQNRVSLGHASMRQRVVLLGGKLDIVSAPGHGTTIRAWVPLKEESREPSARAAG
jgi:signal transduction histidine kinase